MSFWKILGGAALGVGAIAAAPFTGGGSLVGAATLAASLGTGTAVAAAVGAGAAGAYAGKKMSENDEAEKQNNFNQGEAKGRAVNQTKMDELEQKLGQSVLKLKEQHEKISNLAAFYEQLIALEALGVAVAWCDGYCSEEERAAIDTFVKGINGANLDSSYKELAQRIADNPPSIHEAFDLVTKTNVDMAICNQVIELVMLADDHEDDAELAFITKWTRLQAA